MPSMAWSHFTVTQTNSDDTTFWQAMAYYHSQLPHLAKSGVMGYYNISNLIPGNASTPLQLAGGIWILNSSIAAFDAVFTPVLNHTSASYPVKAAHTTQFWSSYYDWWKVYSSPGLVALLDSQIGSRFLDEKALSTPISSLAESLRAAYNPLSVMIANLVSYPGVGTVKPPGGRGSMTPAWRTAIVEMSTSHPGKAILHPANPPSPISHCCIVDPSQRHSENGADGAPNQYLPTGTSQTGTRYGVLQQRSQPGRAEPTSGVLGSQLPPSREYQAPIRSRGCVLVRDSVWIVKSGNSKVRICAGSEGRVGSRDFKDFKKIMYSENYRGRYPLEGFTFSPCFHTHHVPIFEC